MNAQLSHREAKRLFLDLADQALEADQQVLLTAHLDQCTDCRAGWDRYARTVDEVRGVVREKAPVGLATLIVRRARRGRPSGLRAMQRSYAQYRVPVEAVIPLLLGAAVAAFLVLMAP